MGIDSFTTDLASHFRGLDRGVGQHLGRTLHALDAAGLERSSEENPDTKGVLGPFWGYVCARRLLRAVGCVDVRPGNPFAAPGECWMMDVDRVDAEGWETLMVGIGAESGRSRDGTVLPIFDPAWDDFPGIPFGRAVSACNSVVLPSTKTIAVCTASIAVTSTSCGWEFMAACRDLLSLSATELDPDYYDPDEEHERGLLLYNLRLFNFFLSQADDTKRPLGIWG